jgi:hypothetical protein
MGIKQVKSELKARNVSTAGMLEGSELRAALVAAAAPPPPPPPAEQGESSGSAPPAEEEEEDAAESALTPEEAALIAANVNKPQHLLPEHLRRCAGCGLTAQEAGKAHPLRRCLGTCWRTDRHSPPYYCDKACQAAHWPVHRLVCSKPDHSGAPAGKG